MIHDPAESAFTRCRALLEDRKFNAVVEWKAAHPGALAIGHMPIYFPRPLLEAIGVLPVAVFGGGDELEIIRGDSYFQSYICHIPRSTVEMGLSGHLAALDGMLFPSICDVIRNLGGMWKMLFPEKYSSYVDFPQNFNMKVGGSFYAGELRRIARELEARGAQPLRPENLREAIAIENTRRAAILELDTIRQTEPSRLRASEAYLVLRAGASLPAAEHTKLIREVITGVKARAARFVDNVRVLVVGSFCEQPPFELIVALEKAGCDIVDDDFQLGLRMIEGDIETREDEDPVMSLARAFIARGQETASRYIGEGVKGGALVDKARKLEADGVVFAAASFCDPALLDQPMLEQALDRAKIPHTGFKFAENTGNLGTIREQAGAFSDSVKLWGAT